jgi:two-component system phosphate regulon sensor histidine kinase PhoR
LLATVLSTLEMRAADRAVTLTLVAPDDLPPIAADADQITQVFQNLVDNAIKYTRPQTVVTIGVAAVAAAGTAPAGILVSVRDQGEGIPREHLPRLTERFYRVDPARSRQLGGTGLGLAIVKHIVNRHRGRLSVASEPGQGTVFSVFLPLDPTDGDTTSTAAPARKVPAVARTVTRQ